MIQVSIKPTEFSSVCQLADDPAFGGLLGSAIVMGPAKEQILRVLNGVNGTAMAAFRDQFNDVEIAAVSTYIRNAWGNAGKGQDPIVQPSQVTALR